MDASFRECRRIEPYSSRLAPDAVDTNLFVTEPLTPGVTIPFTPVRQLSTVSWIPRMLYRLAFAFLILITPLSLTAQDSAKPKPEAEKKGMMDDHMMGPWKEMNAFHRVMGATWHPASQKGDLAPLKAKAKELLSAADAWAASLHHHAGIVR